MPEPVLEDSDFEKFSRYVREVSGIHLHEGKKALIRARLGKIIRQKNLRSFKEYYDHVVNDKSGYELIILLDSISTNLTHFFREPQHFHFLIKNALPEIMEKKGSSNHIDFWCAGCASGEEAYSIAIAATEALQERKDWAFKILATDISTKVLATARAGIYEKKSLNTVPYALRRQYFQRGENRWKGYFRVKKKIQGKVSFQRLNFMEEFQFRKLFDVIFCRNVMIYFDNPTKRILVHKLYEHLDREGYLFIGHSENLVWMRSHFKYVQPSVYKKI